jgi:hypothetical protein
MSVLMDNVRRLYNVVKILSCALFVGLLISGLEIAAAQEYITKPANIKSYECIYGVCKEIK